MRFLPAFLLALVCATAAPAQKPPAPAPKPTSPSSSSAGKNWRLEVRPEGDGAAVYAVPKAKPSAAAKLADTGAVATTRCFLSAADDVAVIESGSASLGNVLQVFLLTEGTEFLELNDWDVNTEVERARSRAQKLPGPTRPQMKFLRWTGPQSALVSCASWEAEVDFGKRTVKGR